MYNYTTFHEKTMQTLINSVRTSSASHAYIFEGVEGMYKLENARLFANALVCENTLSSPCGKCHACTEALSQTNPDIIFVEHDKGSDGKPKKTIGVEAARNVAADAVKTPYGKRKKVYIIPDGENLTIEAQNALLKTLEEPPEYVVFIIIIPSASMLLQTIISRSAIVSFNPVSADRIKQYIAEKYPDDVPRADFLARYCEGVPGTVDKIIADEAFEELRTKTLDELANLISTNPADAFKIQDFIKDNADKVSEITDMWLSFLRDIAIIHCHGDEMLINSDKADRLRALSRNIDLARCVKGAELLVESKNMLARSVKNTAVLLRCALLL